MSSTNDSLAGWVAFGLALWGLYKIDQEFQVRDQRVWALEGQLETARSRAAVPPQRQFISAPTSPAAPIARPANEPSSSVKVVESVRVKDPTATTIESFGSDLVTAIIKAQKKQIDELRTRNEALVRQLGPGRTIRRN